MMDEYDVFFAYQVLFGRGMSRERKEGRKEGRQEGKKEGRKERRNETRRYPPFFTTKLGSLLFSILVYTYLVITFYYICFDVNSITCTLPWAFPRHAL